MNITPTIKSIMRQRTFAVRYLTFDVAPLPETWTFDVGRSTFGVEFIASSATLPSHLRARIRHESALPCAIVPPPPEPDRNFPHCSKQQPFCQATKPPKIAAVIHSTGLRLTIALRERDPARPPHPAGHRPR